MRNAISGPVSGDEASSRMKYDSKYISAIAKINIATI